MTKTSKPIIKQLNFSQEILDQCEKIKNDKKSPYFKKNQLSKILGVTFCAGCQGIPSLKIFHHMDDLTRVEHYCEDCYHKTLEREKEEPQDKQSLAEFYGCIKQS